MNIPPASVKRLSLYFRVLNPLALQGTRQISSKSLAELLSLNSALVRKDLSYFGSFGTPGSGYDVIALNNKIADILGISKAHNVIVIGAGNLGTALAAHRGFQDIGFNICALFDIGPQKIGKKIKGIPCYAMTDLNQITNNNNCVIAVLAVPVTSAQDVTDKLVTSGIKAILNFTQVRINVPADVKVTSVDLVLKLKSLSFFVSQQKNI